MKNLVIGIDLHGTLLDENECLPLKCVALLREEITKLKRFALVGTCTGNDLLFVKQKLLSVFELFDFHVLETGCTYSLDGISEKVLCSKSEIAKLARVLKAVREKSFPEVSEDNRRRLSELSFFCKNPAEFCSKIQKVVYELGLSRDLHVTHSSVAVDVIPAGYSKFTGIYAIAKGKKTIGIADSVNDYPLIMKSNFAFMPSNHSKLLETKISEQGKKIEELEKCTGFNCEVVFKAKSEYCFGTIEILRKINQVLS